MRPPFNFKTLFLDILMMVFITLFPHFGHLPMFLYPFVVLGILWAYLKYRKQTFADLGFRFKDISIRSLLVGGACGLAYAAFVFWLLTPLMDRIGFAPANLADFNFLRHNLNSYLVLILMACLLVIPYEEIVFRGFIFNRFSGWFPYALSVLLTSILFALYHYQEGTGAVVQIFIFALLQMVLLRQAKGNLWYVIFYHMLYDIFMLTAIYRGYM
jgi:membrane protease YdiL (CAAX protease family)